MRSAGDDGPGKRNLGGRRGRSCVACVLAVAAVVSAISVGAPPAGAQAEIPSTMVLASEQAPADAAVAAGIAAATERSTLAFTRSSTALGARSRSSLQSEQPDVVVLVGGPSALSEELRPEIAALVPEAEIERVAGSGRIATSLAAFERIVGASAPDTVAIMHAWTSDDIAHGAAVVASGGADALLLASCGKLEAAVSDAVAGGRFARIVLIGKLATSRCASRAQIGRASAPTAPEHYEEFEPVHVVAAGNDGRIPDDLRHGVLVDVGNPRELMAAVAAAVANRGTLVLYAHRDRITEASAATLVDWIPQSLTLIGAATNLVEGVGRARQGDAPGVSTSRTAYTSVSAGNAHTCGLLPSGQIECWGDGRDGRTDPPDGEYLEVSAGFRHTCALSAGHRVACWGRDTYGRADPPAGRFATVAAGWQHSCGINADQRLRCWGRSSDGETDAPSGRFVSVAAGGGHSCALRVDGRVACWGANGDGESNAPGGRFEAVEVGFSHSCGIRTNGRIECWGADVDGQLDAPAGAFADVSLGQNSGCALDREGDARCWGADQDGEGEVPPGTFDDIELGGKFSCGHRGDGTVTCWGFRSQPAIADLILP